MVIRAALLTLIGVLSFALVSGVCAAEPAAGDAAAVSFDDFPREDLLVYPDWLKESFLDIPADLRDAVAAGKQGLMVFFGQKRCAYCHQLFSVNFGLADIVEYTRRHFDMVAVDIWSTEEVTTLSGEVMTARDWAQAEGTDFTPAILFYDAAGKLALRLRGYYPPYQFRAALEYVADGHYQRESFRDYLARGDNRMVFDADDLNEEPFFAPAPHNLDRRYPAQRPLAVFFEQGDCHPCDVLHGEVLQTPGIRQRLAELDTVQLDVRSATPVITPDGQRTTAREWAARLGLYYAPAILFFDQQGRELLRLDSVVGFYRLRNVLDYIDSGVYPEQSYAAWRLSRNL